MESIFSEPALQIKALVRNLSAFTTLFAPGKSWERSTASPYTESRLTRSVANERVGFPVVVQQSLNEISTNQLKNRVVGDGERCYSTCPHPFLQKASC
jgi:hypothetical protein